MLTEKDKDRISKLNAKNSWGLNKSQLLSLINKHQSAREKNDILAMARIEYRLTDINFHSYCSLLENGCYNEAKQKIKEEF